MEEKHWWLYVLRLEDDKWYIGITSQTPKKRFLQHLNGFAGAAWTRQHKPIEIHEQTDLGILSDTDAQSIENKLTREYINIHGIDNVRGGDIRYSSDLVVRFGYIFDKEGFNAVLGICFLLAIIMTLFVMYELKP